ncbi:MAG TPA: ubiquitin-like domain-containing protein [bacterium]|jgi:uncharacterized protein YabE (DUF348 family)|nr:ubiquitin-like domain-containing protein [bacterium]
MNKKTPISLTAVILAAGLTVLLVAAGAHAVLRKEVTVVVAGRARQHVTYSRTVGQVLTETEVTLGGGDEVSPSLAAGLSEGARIVIRRAVPLSITVDGKIFRVTSAAATVRDLLHRRGIVLGEHDKVYPAAHSPLWQGATIRVLRITHKVVAERTEIPFRVISSKDPATPRGIVRVKQPGRTGIRERLFRLTFADRVVVNRTLVGERIVRTPLDRVISLGAQVLIVSRGQFAGKELILMVATAYSPWCCPGVDNATAFGMRAGYGVVAVDPAIIPLGSRLYVEGYGYAIAGDTGGSIKGLRIDLGFDTRREAIRFGRRPVRVYVIERRVRK